MSKYLEDVQGKIVSNPINETNTKYPCIDSVDGVRHGDEYPIDSQYMYNHNEPVSDIDTAYYDDYRNKVEELRKRTESTYEALESCLVPVEIPGMSFQPYEFLNTETPDGEVIEEKVKSFTYFFQDHLSPIGANSKEFVFRTNKVKFIDDRHRRLIYDRTIHIMTLKEDEDNRVPFKDVILRTFFEYRDGKYFSLIKNTNASILNYGDIAVLIMDYLRESGEKYTIIDKDGNEKQLENFNEFENYTFKSGIDIDTGIPSTLYNLYNIGWTNAAMVFLNGLAIEWTKIILSVDNIDTFIIVSNLRYSASSLIDDNKEIFLDYVHIPFKVAYLIGTAYNNSLEGKYISDGKLNNQVIFVIYKDYASIIFDSLSSTDFQQASVSYNYDRIICLDPNIKYAEFTLDNDDNKNLKDVGINYTKSFREFCNNDYRCKLKQFNFLGFELDRYFENDSFLKRGTFKNDDFTITWHPFNIMDIRFKRLYNRKRVFKVFYNTKVLYDQDNILRIKNYGRLADEYEKYRQDVTANIETYINEIYILAKKDIGTYLATDGIMRNYKFHYVSPYECFLLYNAINMVMGSSYISFDDFRKINVAGIKDDITVTKSEINPMLIANDDGKCIWKISTTNQCPVVKITDISTSDIVLADVEYSDSNEIIITMDKNNNNISKNTYKVTLYHASYIIGNPKLTSTSGKCYWTINNIDANSIMTSVYESKSNQIVLPDIEIVNDNTIRIIINSNTDILENTYKVAIYVSSIDKHSYLNYLNGGFIAVPKNEDSIFAEKIKEKDIFNENKNLTNTIREYISNIIKDTAATLPDILIPIDNEKRDDDKVASDALYIYEGDSKGKIIPFLPIMNEFGLVQEYDDLRYDSFKLRFELSYLNNMEEGATPIDEFIYYFDNNGLENLDGYPVVNNNNLISRKTALALDALAENIFKHDPHLVLDSIKKLNWSADYIIPKDLGNNKKENYITTLDFKLQSTNYKLDPRFYYNYGYRDQNNIPHKLVSEWGLRRNLPEMFIFSINKDEYTIDSMHLLDEVFDFTYNLDKSYEENLKHGLNYIIGYDADKLEQSIKRSVVSITKTGEDILNILSNNHYEKICTLDRYKLITFIKNKNQKVIFDNIQIIVTVNTLGDSVSPSSIQYVNEEGKTVNFTYAEMRHKSQEHTTIIKNSTSFKDVDKNFEQTFTSVKYNRNTKMLEYYNNDELVITLQVDKVIDLSRVVMSRWNISNQDNYVMIFKNRELYSKYHTIEYTDITFSFEKEENISKTDKFEFVFFLNANNTIMKKICETDEDLKLNIPNGYYSESPKSIRTDINGNPMDKGLYNTITRTITLDKTIPCNTSIIDAENVQLLVNIMPKDENDKWDVTNTENTTYELSYNMKSYRATTSEYNDSRRFIHSLQDDKKINGLHRVTKQGGGEYFLEFDGKVPENPGTGSGGSSGINSGDNKESEDYEDGGYTTDRDITTPYILYLSSKRQFRYKYFVAEEDSPAGTIYVMNKKNYEEEGVGKTYTYKLDDDDFKFCLQNSHLLVFKNGLLLPNTYYYLHSIINNPVNDVGIVFNVPIKTGDKIDIFYVTNDLKHLEVEYYDLENKERYLKNGDIKIAHNNSTEYRVMGEMYPDNTDRTNYIKLRSPLYAISSKHSTFVFLNGKKVRLDELEDISDTIMSINTDYAAHERDKMNAVRLEVMNHLDTQDIIEQVYINDGLNHDDIQANQFDSTDIPNVYKSTKLIKSVDLTQLEAYAKRTLLDDILNDLSNENLNKLFYNYDTAKGPMTPYNASEMNEPDFIKKDDVINAIIDEYYISEDPDAYIITDTAEGNVGTVFYVGDKDKVRIPKSFNDVTTESVFGTTFNNNNFIKKVIIPEGIESID